MLLLQTRFVDPAMAHSAGWEFIRCFTIRQGKLTFRKKSMRQGCRNFLTTQPLEKEAGGGVFRGLG